MPSEAATDDLAALASETPSRDVGGAHGGREIVLRVISAAVMVPLGLWVVHEGGWPLLIATGLCAAIAAGEWTLMAARNAAAPVRFALLGVMGATALSATYLGQQQGLELAALASLVGAGSAAGLAVLGKSSAPSMAFGALYTSLPFAAFVWLRGAFPDDQGRLYLFAVLAIVWATDIAAYFAGRGFGGPLLSPKDSPNKTWTGAIGAVICACLAGVAVARAFGGDLGHWLAASFLLSMIAQAGDLLESRFKRLYGVKDSSGLLPGHGGVLDRLDATMAATIVFAAVVRLLPVVAPDFSAG